MKSILLEMLINGYETGITAKWCFVGGVAIQ